MKLREIGTCALAIALVAQMLATMLPFRASGQVTWTIHVVEGAADAGQEGIGLAFNASGSPHIAFHNATGTSLDHAYWNGTQWLKETIYSPGDPGYYPSLKFDTSGNAHVAYRDGTDLAYSNNTGGTWNRQVVDLTGNVGYFPSLVLRGGTLPSISHYDVGNTALKYVSYDGVTWSQMTVDNTGDVGWYSSLALDTSGYPHISYYNSTGSDLKHAWWDGALWQIETVDSIGAVGRFSSIAIDSLDVIHISYANETGAASLKYASRLGPVWTYQTVDAGPDVGLHTSIALNGDLPSIAYYDVGNARLKFAMKTGLIWNTEIVDDQGGSGDVGQYASLAFGPGGDPGIAYYDAVNSDVKYAGGILTYIDLTIAPGDVLFTPPEPFDAGAVVTINATVHNTGNENATGVLVRFYDGAPIPANQIDGDRVIPFLPRGGSFGVDVSWTAQPVGLHCINTVVDPMDTISELTEDNNAAVNCVQVKGPDLLLTPSEITWSPPGNVSLSSSVPISANVSNQGLNDASSVVVRFWDGLPGSTQIGTDQIIPLITAGGNETAGISWTAQPPGSHQICVQTDPDDSIVESNETNNDACVAVIVTLPDLETRAGDLVAVPPGPVFDGTPMTFNLTFRNIGGLTANGVVISLYDGLPGSGSEVLLGNRTSPSMPPGTSQLENWSWSANGTGAHTFYGVLDGDGTLTELGESNNEANVTVIVTTLTDFLTKSLTATPPGPVMPGVMVDLNATWENQGVSTATAEFAMYEDLNGNSGLDAGEQLASWRLTLAGVENASRSSTWSSTSSGIHSLCALADSLDEVTEIQEGNNQMCLTVEVLGKPDLIPVNPLPPPPITVGIGQVLQLSVQVKNQGGSVANASMLAFYNQSGLFQFFSVPSLDPNVTSSRYTALWNAPNVTGDYTVTAEVDDGDMVDESNETNNRHFFQIRVSDLPQSTLYIGTPNYTASSVFVSSSTPLTLVARDFSGTGIKQILFAIDGGLPNLYTSPFVLAGEGIHMVDYYSEDNAGNVEQTKTRNFTVDNSPPTSSRTVGTPNYAIGGLWIDYTSLITLTAVDNPALSSGIKSSQFRVYDGSNWGPWTVYMSAIYFFDETTYVLEYVSTDNLGNVEGINSLSFKVDNTPPSVSPNVGTPRYRAAPGDQWNITPATPITAMSLDQGATAVGVQLTEYSLDGGGWTTYSAAVMIAQEGPHSVSFRATDRLGHNSSYYNVTVIVDSTHPVTNVQVGMPQHVATNTWVTSSTPFTLTSLDGGSPPVGLKTLRYRVWGVTWTGWTAYSTPFALGTPEGQRYLEVESSDYLDNIEPVQNRSLLVDASPPTGQISVLDPKYTDATTLFVSAKTNFTLSGADSGAGASGLNKLQYSIDGSVWTDYTAGFNLSATGEGAHSVAFNATDNLGHFSTGARDVVLDKTPPTTSFQHSVIKGNGTIWLNATDARVGVNSTHYSINLGQMQIYAGPFTLQTGNYRVDYYSDDLLGNEEVIKTSQINVTSGGGGDGDGGGPGAEETNIAPAVGVVLGIILMAVGMAVRRRSRKAMTTGVLFGALDIVTGISSTFMPDLEIPPWAGMGLIVLLLLSVLGIVVVLLLARRGAAAQKELKAAEKRKRQESIAKPPPRKVQQAAEEEEPEEMEEPDESELEEALKSLEDLEE